MPRCHSGAFFVAIAAVAFGMLVFVGRAEAGRLDRELGRLDRELYRIAGQRFRLDCTYAARGGALAIAFPPWRGQPPVVYVKPRVCRAVYAFARTGKVSRAAALGLLVVVHEAHHVAGLIDEAETECLALHDVAGVAGRVAPGTGARMSQLAYVWHKWLVARYPGYEGTC